MVRAWGATRERLVGLGAAGARPRARPAATTWPTSSAVWSRGRRPGPRSRRSSRATTGPGRSAGRGPTASRIRRACGSLNARVRLPSDDLWLVDDVVTTGATLDRLRRRAAGGAARPRPRARRSPAQIRLARGRSRRSIRWTRASYGRSGREDRGQRSQHRGDRGAAGCDPEALQAGRQAGLRSGDARDRALRGEEPPGRRQARSPRPRCTSRAPRSAPTRPRRRCSTRSTRWPRTSAAR